MVYSDASDIGFGGYTVEDGGEVAHGHWDPMKAQRSLIWCELSPLRLVLESLTNKLQSCTVK